MEVYKQWDIDLAKKYIYSPAVWYLFALSAGHNHNSLIWNKESMKTIHALLDPDILLKFERELDDSIWEDVSMSWWVVTTPLYVFRDSEPYGLPLIVGPIEQK